MFVQEAAARGLQARVYYDDYVAGVTPFESAKVILNSDHRPDFIFAGTDFGAAAVLRAATDIGMNVPNDLGIVGAGNTILAFASVPPLSSLNLFQRSLAEAAVGKLLDDIEGRDFEQESRLPVELIVRASSQRHPSATRHG